jgi:spore maturation protein CgeB
LLNVNRDGMARFGFSPATRVFEAAGAGACLITDAFAGVETFFEPGEEILVAHDGNQVAEIVSGLSASAARSIGQAALRRVLADHTYTQRVELVEQVLSVHLTVGAA